MTSITSSTNTQFLSNDSIVRSLQDRNTKLREEIRRIQQTLAHQASISKRILPRQNLISAPAQDVMIKELENAHKMIKVYQTQIKNADKSNVTSVFQRIQSLEKVSLDKNEEIKGLKKKLYTISKSIDGNSRKLTTFTPSMDDSEFKVSKLHQQASSLKYFVQEAVSKYNQSQTGAAKQLQRVKQLQKSLIELGVSQKQLHEIKAKCSRRQTSEARLKFTEQKEQIIEDRTIDKFNQMKNELKVLAKLHSSYEKQIELLSKDTAQIIIKSQKAQGQIKQTEQRVTFILQQIAKMRKEVKPDDKRTKSVKKRL